MTILSYEMASSRRQFGKGVLAALPAWLALAKSPAKTDGVTMGVCTYSFRSLQRQDGDAIGPTIQALKDCNADICELFSPQLEPEDTALARAMQAARAPGPDGNQPSRQEVATRMRAARNSGDAAKYREQVRQWRLTTPMVHFEQVRKQFDGAGVEIYAYTLNFNKEFTDDELDKCFQQAKALKAKTIASSTQVSMLPRLKPLAEKHKIYVAVHGHSDTTHPDEFSSPDTFQKALDMSDWFRVNLDIGHFSAAGFDPVAYIQEHHARITHIHVKDRKKNNGPNEPFGQGDTPIGPVLQLLQQKQYPIPALVEYEYQGQSAPVEEVNKCLAYMKHCLQRG
jgi:sugar phosphate isomerase/epimerase